MCKKTASGGGAEYRSSRLAGGAPKHNTVLLSTPTASVPTCSLSLRSPQTPAPLGLGSSSPLPLWPLFGHEARRPAQTSKRNAPAGCSRRYDCMPPKKSTPVWIYNEKGILERYIFLHSPAKNQKEVHMICIIPGIYQASFNPANLSYPPKAPVITTCIVPGTWYKTAHG